jgi:polar amino acid transport system substrate-binding protein
LIATLACSLAPYACAADGSLQLVTEESPPFNMTVDGKLVGIAVDKVVELMARAKQPYSLTMLPWARAYQMAENDANTCVFSTTRTPEREPKFQWVGPLAANSWTFYAAAARNLRLNGLEDARPYKIGTYNADVRDSYLRNKGFDVDTASSDMVNPRKLAAGRIDLWATGPVAARAILAEQGLADKIVPVLTFNRVALYLACNLGMSRSVVDKLNATLQGMDADGAAAKIDARYDRP